MSKRKGDRLPAASEFGRPTYFADQLCVLTGPTYLTQRGKRFRNQVNVNWVDQCTLWGNVSQAG